MPEEVKVTANKKNPNLPSYWDSSRMLTQIKTDGKICRLFTK